VDHDLKPGLNVPPPAPVKTTTQVQQELLAPYSVGKRGFLPSRPACELGSTVQIAGRDDLKIVIIAQPNRDNDGMILSTEQILMVDWDLPTSTS
jgi:hypothetical protein